MPGNIQGKSLVLIDWDGTLSHSRFWESFRTSRPEIFDKIQASLFGEDRQLVREWMVGKKSSEEICDWLSSQINVDAKTLIETLSKDCQRMRIIDDATRWISELRKAAYVVLVTDNMDCFSRWSVGALALDGFFDRIVNSSDVGRLKCDESGRTLVELSDAFAIPFEKSYLIDDSEKTCELFTSLGGHSNHVGENWSTVDSLRFIMREKILLEIKKIREAIRYHRDQKGDDRCWVDDYRLWAVLEDTPPKPTALPGREEMMRRCREFFVHRRANAPDIAPRDSEPDPQKWDNDLAEMSNDVLQQELDRLKKAVSAHRDIHGRPLTIENDRDLYLLLPEKLVADFRLPPEGEFLGEEKSGAGCPAFWRSHCACNCNEHDIHRWGPCK